MKPARTTNYEAFPVRRAGPDPASRSVDRFDAGRSILRLRVQPPRLLGKGPRDPGQLVPGPEDFTSAAKGWDYFMKGIAPAPGVWIKSGIRVRDQPKKVA